MNKLIKTKSVGKNNKLAYTGWILICLLFSWGNTSLGFIFLMIHSLIYLYKNRKSLKFKKIINKKIYLFLVLFIIWSLISSLFAYDKKLAFTSTIVFAILLLVTIFETQILITLKKNNYKVLLPTISIGITISVLYIIYNYFSTDISRATGIFSNINDTGTLLMVSLIFVISYFEFLKNKYRYLMLIPGILGSLAILLTLSRGSFIGLIAGLTTYSLRSKKHIVVFVIIILLMSAVIYSNPKLNNRFFDSITIRENMDRIYIWLSSVEMIKDYPIKGVGPGNFPIIYPLYKHDYDQKTHTMSYAHNIFLNMAVETGLIGFILFSAIIIIILIMAIKIYNKNALSRGVVAAFLSVLIHNQFDCTILKFEIGVVFWILTGLIIAICFSDKNHKVT